jgi:hypothetical protein
MKKVLLLAAVAVIAGAPFAGSAVARDRAERVALTANQIVAQEDVRIARIKADLRLTVDQEKNWPGLESALRDAGKARADRQVAFQADREQQQQTESDDLIAYLTNRAKVLADRSADMKKLAEAAQPLYASLDDQQKKRFANQLMELGSGRGAD